MRGAEMNVSALFSFSRPIAKEYGTIGLYA